MCSGHVSADMNAQRMYLIRVAGHLGVRLRATPPPRALDDEELFAIEGSKNSSAQCPDGVQVTVKSKGLMNIISRFRQKLATAASTVRLLRSQACNKRREHRARCTVTRNQEAHTTAVVDDERGHKQESKTESTSGAEYHQHVEKTSKSTRELTQNMYPLSNQA